MQHDEFEKLVMNMLLEGSDPRLAILKKQYLSSPIIQRKFTGGQGFFTIFEVSDEFVEEIFNGRINDLQARITNNDGRYLEGEYLFFILYVTNGKIDTLECFTSTTYAWDYNYDNITDLVYFNDNYREYELK